MEKKGSGKGGYEKDASSSLVGFSPFSLKVERESEIKQIVMQSRKVGS